MSKTYCREDCRACEWVASTLEGVRPYWFCDAEGVCGDGPEMAYCPACGTKLLPDGETEEMVSRANALKALGATGVWCTQCEASSMCDPPETANEEGFADYCAETRLAYAEQQAAGGRPE